MRKAIAVGLVVLSVVGGYLFWNYSLDTSLTRGYANVGGTLSNAPGEYWGYEPGTFRTAVFVEPLVAIMDVRGTDDWSRLIGFIYVGSADNVHYFGPKKLKNGQRVRCLGVVVSRASDHREVWAADIVW